MTPRDLPTFIVIGAMKAGTTSLYHYLRNHEQIFMPKIKELDFFAEGGNWSRGMDWYRQQFHGAGDAVARGEASTLYTKYPQYDGVPERIAAALPDVRLVYLVRDPIVRMRSHYEHRVALGAETAPPEIALLENPIYLAYSQYAMQLERYAAHFPREQLLVVTSEGLRHDRAVTVREVYEFLGVDPSLSPPALETEFYKTSQRRSYPPIVWSARRFLKRHVPQAKRAKEVVDSMLERRAASSGAGSAASGTASADTVITPELRARLAELLRDDVARLRPYMSPGFDGWGIG
ncbi:sulfotransferase family protein [Blastococcus capsensis]|uniref:sulfotransferase family protein n=1 Tax=Blastococcus capsensis TaxID=1564163 RepID=UPI0025413FDA|nr:sulfotransferase domain-containing protein [Blastococcus capsensis]MDK3257094.1 sulfotransferase [Blastococcus capsensis]